MSKAILREKRQVLVKLPGYASARLYPNRGVSVGVLGWGEVAGIIDVDTSSKDCWANRQVGLKSPFRELGTCQ